VFYFARRTLSLGTANVRTIEAGAFDGLASLQTVNDNSVSV